MTGERPVPVPDAQSAPYWDAAASGGLALARCGSCRALVHPPAAACPACGSTDPAFAFEAVSGRGLVRSWTIVRQAFLPGFDREVPYVLVDVELEEQPDLRLVGRLLDGPGAPLALGARVVVTVEQIADGVAVPAFALEADA